MHRPILPLSRPPARRHHVRLLLLRTAQRPSRPPPRPPHPPRSRSPHVRFRHPPHPGREAHLSPVPRPTLPHPLRHRHLPAGTDGTDPPPPRSPLLRQEAPDEQPADSLLRLLPSAERLHPRQRPRGQPPCLHRKPHSRSPRTRPRRLRCERVDPALLAVTFSSYKHRRGEVRSPENIRRGCIRAGRPRPYNLTIELNYKSSP
ncbi:hypothetical protein B5F91_10215 [Bacteroides sp. An322]|nr:hypothetical protein B5F91_10215 [Bacteroides sp. An322]